MNACDVNAFIGRPWRAGARGPDAYDCWGLLMVCRERHFGGGIPEVLFGDPARALYAEKLRSGEWEIVAQPQHGDGVLLREGDEPHVGLYLDLDGGGVLHALRGAGVIFTYTRELRLAGFSKSTYYRIHA